MEPGAAKGYDEYVSDPAKPVPYIGHVLMGMRYDYMTEDQRFAAMRPDVLVYKTRRSIMMSPSRGRFRWISSLHFRNRFRFRCQTDRCLSGQVPGLRCQTR